LALQLGHSLLQVAKLKLSAAIRSVDAEGKMQAEDFISLHSSDFNDLVATPAHASVKLKPRTLDELSGFRRLRQIEDLSKSDDFGLVFSIEERLSQ
jgi:hypothetical protein